MPTLILGDGDCLFALSFVTLLRRIRVGLNRCLVGGYGHYLLIAVGECRNAKRRRPFAEVRRNRLKSSVQVAALSLFFLSFLCWMSSVARFQYFLFAVAFCEPPNFYDIHL